MKPRNQEPFGNRAASMRVEVWVLSPELAVGFHASRNLSRAPPALLRNRLRRPWTEPICRQARQQSGSGGGSEQDKAQPGALA